MAILAIDPSKNNLGFAIWQNGKWSRGTFHPPSDVSLEEKLQAIGKFLIGLKWRLHMKGEDQLIQSLVIEYPTFMGSVKGQIAAQKGYTIDLGCVCGFIIGLIEVDPMNCHLYTPMQWKGTMPKSATTAAFRRVFKAKALIGEEQDAIDATMLLHWHLRKIKAI